MAHLNCEVNSDLFSLWPMLHLLAKLNNESSPQEVLLIPSIRLPQLSPRGCGACLCCLWVNTVCTSSSHFTLTVMGNSK